MHARHGEDAAAGILRHRAQLLIGVVRARDGVDRAVDVVEAVIVVGTEHAVRQIALYVLAEVMHVAPRRANLCLVHLGAQLEVDNGLPGARLAFDLFEPRDILKPPLELVRDLLLHLGGGRARPCGGDDHLTDGERGIFHAPEGIVGENTADGKDDDEIPHEAAVAQGKLGEIPHCVRTASPSCSPCTPAVTTTACAGSPSTTASLSWNAVTVTARRCTAPSSTM